MTDILVDALDEGARKLLEMAMAPEKDAEGRPNPTTLAERVKAFDSVVSWAQTRLKLAPPTAPETKFDGIQRQFFGDANSPKRGRPSRKSPRNADIRVDAESGDAAELSIGNSTASDSAANASADDSADLFA